MSSLCWQIATAYKQDVLQIPPSDSMNLVDHFHTLLKVGWISNRYSLGVLLYYFWPKYFNIKVKEHLSFYMRITSTKYCKVVTYNLQTVSEVGSQRPLILVLDSLDQLSPSRQATSFLWLPHTLPANVHVVVSTLPDSECGLLMALRSIVTEPSHFIDILPLGPSVGLNALCCWMSEVGLLCIKQLYL